MQEALLHYLWKNSLFKPKEYTADTGELIKIIEPGLHNHDGGPDFTNARVEIDGTVWAGNIEIHSQASEWYNHNHDSDRSYDNVILHVVTVNNRICYNSQGRQIPCINLSIDEIIQNRYNELFRSKNTIPCSHSVNKIDPTRKSFWLNALTIKRLEKKSSYFQELLSFTKNNWEETLFIHLARSIGLKTNALPFELLAKSISLKFINSQPGNIFRTEAILFGQAGFLEEDAIDEYHRDLKKEYEYHRKKYRLKPIDKHLWKFLRLRPLNFPTIRIAQLSDLLSKNSNLLSQTLSCSKIEEIYSIYSCGVSKYWNNHYTFGNQSTETKKYIGSNALNSIIINTLVPLMFVYGEMKNHNELKERAIYYLEHMPPEKNHITRMWKKLNFVPENAADSQALIELTESYCLKKHCLDCQIGHLILNLE